MTILEALREAATVTRKRHIKDPVWNIREADRQGVVIGILRDILDQSGGVPVGAVAGGRKSAFVPLESQAELRTSRVHAELKVAFPLRGGETQRNKYDVVVFGQGPITLKRDGYGPCNLELLVEPRDVAAVVEIKSESHDWRASGKDGHGASEDFEKLLRLSRECAHMGLPIPLLGQIVLDTGLPVEPLGYLSADWATSRKPGWRWPVAGTDAERRAPADTVVWCWTLDEFLVLQEWCWRPGHGWELTE